MLEVFQGQTNAKRDSKEMFVSFNSSGICYLSGAVIAAMGWDDDTKLEVSVDRDTSDVWITPTDNEHAGVRHFTPRGTVGQQVARSFSFSKKAQKWLGVDGGRRYPAYKEDDKIRISLMEARPPRERRSA